MHQFKKTIGRKNRTPPLETRLEELATVASPLSGVFVGIGDKPGLEKIVIGVDAGIHYTILFNKRDKIINIHKTLEQPTDPSKYKQLLDIPFFTFGRLLVAIRKENHPLLQKFMLHQRVGIGKLCRHHLIAFPLSPDDGQASILFHKRKKKIVAKSQITVESFRQIFLYPDEIPPESNQSFWLYANKRGHLTLEGLIFKPTKDYPFQKYCFVSQRNFLQYQRALQMKMLTKLETLNFKSPFLELAYNENSFK